MPNQIMLPFKELTPYYRLRLVRQCKFKTAKDFAVSIGVQQSNYSAQEKGTRPMSDKMINKYCELLGANADWVKTGEGVGYDDPELQAIINDAVEADHVMVNNSTVNIAILTAIITEVEAHEEAKQYPPHKKAVMIGAIYEETNNITQDETEQLKLVPRTAKAFLRMAGMFK